MTKRCSGYTNHGETWGPCRNPIKPTAKRCHVHQKQRIPYYLWANEPTQGVCHTYVGQGGPRPYLVLSFKAPKNWFIVQKGSVVHYE